MRRRFGSVFGLFVVLVLGSGASALAANPQIRVLSNRADLISGGDALVQVVGGDTGSVSANSVGGLGALQIKLNGVDVTNVFGMRSDGRVMGLLEGPVARRQRGDGERARRQARQPHDRQSPDRRSGALRPADPAVDVLRGRDRQAVQPPGRVIRISTSRPSGGALAPTTRRTRRPTSRRRRPTRARRSPSSSARRSARSTATSTGSRSSTTRASRGRRWRRRTASTTSS